MGMAGKNEPVFAPVNPNPDFPFLERELLGKWQRQGIVKKYLVKNSKSKKRFSFLDGPITANNPMGVHHAWGRTYKDLFQRYKNMQGFAQRFQNGFDCQGLWVEVEVEKELGLKSKKDIENLVPGDPKASIAKFIELCRERVLKFSKIQTEQSKRLGYFMNWDNSYFTFDDENNYAIWNFLAKCHERGLVYKGLDTVPWCPRCGTSISQHEILTEEYQELTHTALTVKFPIVGRDREYLLIWTTTPWTLPGNVAVAASPKLIYSRVRVGQEIYYIAKERIIPVLGDKVEVLDELTGDRLLNLTYKGPFDNLPRVDSGKRENPRTFHITVDGSEYISASEGTGLVHIAPGAGHEDFELGKKFSLPLILLIDEEANYLDGLGLLEGKNVSQPGQIIKVLEEEGWLVKKEEYSHRYPVCWRCRTELVFRAVEEWYIRMDPVRALLGEVSKKINWIPSWGLERELDWLKNMSDWLISKKRYWGLALPIWECSSSEAGCGWFTVISGKEELKEKAGESWKNFSGHSPHRPWVDEVRIKCEKCGEFASRIPDVGNPWLDAGIVPFSTLPKGWFPADFITESFPGQFKNWFYSLICMSSILKETNPVKLILGFASLLGEDGKPMHKSWGNAIEFNEGADKIGVDTMRFLYAKQNPADNLLFGYKVADETRRAFHLPLWNIYNFFVTYANFDAWRPRRISNFKFPVSNSILDRWILIRLKQLIQITTSSLDKYDAATASRELETFVQDLSIWYIRRSRDRVGPSATNEKDKESFYKTCYFVLVNLSRLLAPFTPFIAEVIFTNLTELSSVHLEDWPRVEPLDSKDIQIIEKMEEVRAAAEAGHAQRKEVGIQVRQPLSRATVASKIPSPGSAFLDVLALELNVKEISWKKKAKLKKPVVALNTKITAELKEEGEARELVRTIQEERRKRGLGFEDVVSVTSPWLPSNKKLLKWVRAKTLAQTLGKGDSLKVQKL